MQPNLWVAFAFAALVLSVVPGPDMLCILSNATVGGRRAGVVSAMGMALGVVVHTVAASLGLSALVQAAPEALGLLASTASEQLLRRRSVRRWLERVSAAVFGALAVRLVAESR